MPAVPAAELREYTRRARDTSSCDPVKLALRKQSLPAGTSLLAQEDFQREPITEMSHHASRPLVSDALPPVGPLGDFVHLLIGAVTILTSLLVWKVLEGSALKQRVKEAEARAAQLQTQLKAAEQDKADLERKLKDAQAAAEEAPSTVDDARALKVENTKLHKECNELRSRQQEIIKSMHAQEVALNKQIRELQSERDRTIDKAGMPAGSHGEGATPPKVAVSHSAAVHSDEQKGMPHASPRSKVAVSAASAK